MVTNVISRPIVWKNLVKGNTFSEPKKDEQGKQNTKGQTSTKELNYTCSDIVTTRSGSNGLVATFPAKTMRTCFTSLKMLPLEPWKCYFGVFCFWILPVCLRGLTLQSLEPDSVATAGTTHPEGCVLLKMSFSCHVRCFLSEMEIYTIVLCLVLSFA